MACRTGCATQDHGSWGECARAAKLKIAYCGVGGGDATKQRKWDAELDSYRAARAEGIQPASTRSHDIRLARELSDATGVAFNAETVGKVD